MYEKEVELQEIEMSEAKTSESDSKKEENDNNIDDDDITTILLNDIKKLQHYETRNKPTQTLNSFFITNKGTFTAGTLIANTPGDSKQEQKAYLANMLHLPKSQILLIKNLFFNSNGWYAINFK
jgi:hypothetical protein